MRAQLCRVVRSAALPPCARAASTRAARSALETSASGATRCNALLRAGVRRSASSSSTTTPLADLRNIGILAHIDAGKTTTTERMLLYSGFTRVMGDVDSGSTVTDFLQDERERGITIQSACVRFPWANGVINLVDTPGHVDFTIEVERALSVLDGAVVILDGVKGVEAQTETVWRQADRYQIPRIVMVNKLDREGADFHYAVSTIPSRLGVKAIPIQLPLGQSDTLNGVFDLVRMETIHFDKSDEGKTVTRLSLDDAISEGKLTQSEQHEIRRARESLVEFLADLNDDIAERFLEGKDPDVSSLLAALRRGVLAREFVPVLCGAAARNVGVQPLMDAIVDFLPSPQDAQQVAGNPSDINLEAFVFKVTHDAQKKPMSFVRIYKGELRRGQTVFSSPGGNKERLLRLVRVNADDIEELESVSAGDIAGVFGLKESKTGSTLVSKKADLEKAREGLVVPSPVFVCSIEAENAAAEPGLLEALRCVQREDPSLVVTVDDETGQTLLAGMGELHIDVAYRRLVRDFGAKCSRGRVLVNYRESVRGSADVMEPLCETGGDDAPALHVRISPRGPHAESTAEEHDVQHVDTVKLRDPTSILVMPHKKSLGSAMASALVRGTEIGLGRGPLSALPVSNVAVSLDSSALRHGSSGRGTFGEGAGVAPALSDPDTLQRLVAESVQRAVRAADPCLLEPVMDVEVTVHTEHVGTVLSDITSRRRGTVVSVEEAGSARSVVLARVPLAALIGYATDLRSATRGGGSFQMAFCRYDTMPAAEEQAALADIRGF